MGRGRVELPTPALSEQCSNRLSYRPALAPRQGALIGKMLLAPPKKRARNIEGVYPTMATRRRSNKRITLRINDEGPGTNNVTMTRNVSLPLGRRQCR